MKVQHHGAGVGESRLCEAWSIYGFWALFKKKNAKLGTKVNIYLELKKKPQKITNLKKLTYTTNTTKFRKKNNICIT